MSTTVAEPALHNADTRPFASGSISMRIYQHDDLGAEGIAATLVAQAQKAISVGFDGLMMGEHHGGFPGYMPNTQQVAAWMLGAMPKGWVAPAPVLMPIRPWAFVAEDIAWLNARFPGRIGAGVGAGSLVQDFDIMETPKDGYLERYRAAVPLLTAALRGEAEGKLADDPAIIRCREHPVPVLAASVSPRGCRLAGTAGCGLLFESMTPPERLRELVQIYRDHGGSGPIVLIRRVWVGGGSFERQAKQVGVYRSYSGRANSLEAGEQQLVNGAAEAMADELSEAVRAVGADALNLRIHVPGISSEEIMDQLDGVGEVIALVRKHKPWRT